MAYTSQQIADVTAQLLAQGYSPQDIATGASRYGIEPGQLIQAAQQANPDLYMPSSEIISNVNAGNLDANSNDTRYQNLSGMAQGVYGLVPDPAPGALADTWFTTNNGVASTSPVGMNQTQQLISDSMAQGFSAQDIAKGAYNKGIGSDQLTAALQMMNPSVYGNADTLTQTRGALDQAYQGFGSPASAGGDRTQQLIRDSMAQGFGVQDIARGAYNNGISVDQLTGALQGMNPSVYGNADTLSQTRGALEQAYKGFAAPIPTPAPTTSPTPAPTPGPGGFGVNTQTGSGPAYGGGPSYGSFANWNPYLGLMGDDISRRTQLGLGDAFNQIRSNAVGVGGLGGSRQGVAQGVAIGRAMDSMQGQLGNLYGGLWEGAQNRGLSQYGIDTNAALTGRGQDMGFYTQQRGQDLQSLGLGADLYSRGLAGEWSPIQNATSAYSPFSGYGTTTNSGQQGGGWQGLLGGALAGGSFGRQMNWW